MADLIPDSWRLEENADMPNCCHQANRFLKKRASDRHSFVGRLLCHDGVCPC